MPRDPGQPHFFEGLALAEGWQVELPGRIGHISLRNTGVNTLWVSWNGKDWFDVAAGTSYDEDIDIRTFHVKTLNGWTTFMFNGVIWN